MTPSIVDPARSGRSYWRDRVRGSATSLVPRFRAPSTPADLMQIVKAVVAAVTAWVLAHGVLGLAEAFLAPWVALLTVHATVYRSFTRGSQAVVATIIGVLLSYGIVEVIGPSSVALGLALLVGLLVGTMAPIRDEGSTVATTALFLITAGQAEQGGVILDRLQSTGIGVAMGIVVNLAIFAPIDARTARLQIDTVCRTLGDLLARMSRELRDAGSDINAPSWIESSREADERLGHAWVLMHQTREARIGNPRRRSRHLDAEEYVSLLRRLEEGVAQTRAIARTIDQSNQVPDEWGHLFRETWLPLLEAVGMRLHSPDADVASLRPDVERLVRDLSHSELASEHWPVYGSLIDSTLNIDVVDDVASAREVRT